MTEKIYTIKRKRYYRKPQTMSLQHQYTTTVSACTGCALRAMRDDDSIDFSCPYVEFDDRIMSDNQPLLCQDYKPDESTWDGERYEDFTTTRDHIFIPASKQGIAAYVAHILEYS